MRHLFQFIKNGFTSEPCAILKIPAADESRRPVRPMPVASEAAPIAILAAVARGELPCQRSTVNTVEGGH